LPIVPKAGTACSFITAGSDLIVAAAMRSPLDGEETPGIWVRRLAPRYDDRRNPRTGLGALRISHVELVPANGMMLLSCARAFRLTGDPRPGEMVPRLAAGMGRG